MSIIIQGNTIVQGSVIFGYQLLLDVYSGAAAAYSLRKLSSTYSGSAIRVRRSSDNTEQDIGFDSNGNLNETALTTFVGAGNGFVTTWYDQSGNNQNLTQTTSANQPRIVNGGVVEKKNNKPTLYFDIDKLNASSPLITLTHSIFITYENDLSLSSGLLGQWASGQVGRFVILSNQNCQGANFIDRLNIFNSSATDGACTGAGAGLMKDIIVDSSNLNLITSISKTGANEWKTYKNNTFNDDATVTALYTGVNTAIGAYSATQNANLIAYVSEAIIYQTDQSSNRVGIQNNINSYYSIY